MSSPVYDPKVAPKVLDFGTYVWAGFMTACIFLLLPISEFIGNDDNTKTLREVAVTEPPPEMPPPPEEKKEEEKEEETKPELQAEQQMIDLTQLQAALATGTGGFGANFGMVNFETMGPSLDEMIFDVKDLDRVPRVIKQGRLEYPFELKRERIEGSVRLKVIIDQEGRVSVVEVVENTHRAFIKPAIDAAEASIFEPPTRNGQKVKAYYFLPIRFSLRE